ncbi:bifunctional phosphopantothenoylcysteine decarboxylase/phosphopantothenate--cysteine ligase CoaBC [bacterium]|nr:bifunctional phosphopantothenoylcysteine decarboxylase/phosphopantothenate--cysteine ligase CoaBC [bacterium]
MLNGKNILIGITGGIAAYKICELIRMFKRNNANVRVVCTPNALNFVTKLTLQNLSQNEVGVEEFNIEQFKPEHISYADEADIMIIAPATANTIGKIANGICDNLLTSIACAFTKPMIIAPAMNCGMWDNQFVQENLEKLSSAGYYVLEPDEGFLACGYNGKGRLCELQKIFDKTVNILNGEKFLSGKKIVITAGGTIEEIDSVRYISNYSSGKMGIALADEAYKAGAEVILISTVNAEKPYGVIKVKSAEDMKFAVENEYDTADCIIMAAAVADYRAKNIANHKMKKADNVENITVELVKNPDILQSLCKRKNSVLCGSAVSDTVKEKAPVIVGFCAESENLIENAKVKIAKKGCDYLIANDISRKDIGFSSDYNEVSILRKDGAIKHLDRMSKNDIAKSILKEIYG